ncbi:hypothetical protein [Bdellovibrio reynosensis]|uniref:Uncharacterized protein n=1 Tax=Bdellovibrio reynosensis TaxID=2835041 RepID=A0ABY4C7U8_9BACT|nr:hypothetical protein [Bdellovibrio reynosensis]UOF00539.1 hypothetical protein MNR06_12605 [Bdellovibrio reynosensis]
MKTIIKIMVALSFTMSSAFSFAADKATGGIEATANAKNGAANNASVKDGADKSNSANKGAQLTQYLTGAMMFAMAASQKPPCSSGNGGSCALMAAFTMMGVLSMMQGKEHGSAAKSAGLTSSLTDGLGDNPFDYSDVDLTNPNNPLSKDPSVKALGNNIKSLQSAGYNAKKGTITTPDGKSYKAKDFSSAAAMAAAGLPPGAAMGIAAAYDEASKKAASKVEKIKLGSMTATAGFEEGGGGGMDRPSSEGSDEAPAYAATGGDSSAERINLERDPSSLAGMQKDYNGEPIGVAADSIFLMMTRRYKVKESQESFYNDAELALQK